jgi:hypothetical protein
VCGRSFSTAAAAPASARIKGLTIMVNSLFNSWRMKDVWLDK